MLNYDLLPALTGAPEDVEKAAEYRDKWLSGYNYYNLDIHRIADAVRTLANDLRFWADLYHRTDGDDAYKLTKDALDKFWAVKPDDYNGDRGVNTYLTIVARYTEASWWIKYRGSYTVQIARDLVDSVRTTEGN